MNVARGGAWRAACVLLLVLTMLVGGCRATGEAMFPSLVPPGPYDELSDRGWEGVVLARENWDAGDLRLARAALRRIASEFPRNIAVGVLVQELELELLAYGVALPDLRLPAGAAGEEGRGAAATLRRHYRELADRAPRPENLVLAARLESDLPAARGLLTRALELDPECAWAHYGLAHVEYAAGRFQSSSAALERALELDPRHLSARRLRARMLVTSETAKVAAEALERWLRDARGHPFVGPLAVAEAEFDLALLSAELGEAERVEVLCSGLLEGGWIDPASVYLVLAATRVAEGEIAAALDAARRASRSSPDLTLAHVQRALLLEDWLSEPERAFEAWARALEAATDRFDAAASSEPGAGGASLRDAQLWLFARTRLARLEALGLSSAAGVSGS